MKNFFYQLPNELICKIYEYDPTLKKNYNILMVQLLKEAKIIKFYWSKKYSIRIKTYNKH